MNRYTKKEIASKLVGYGDCYAIPVHYMNNVGEIDSFVSLRIIGEKKIYTKKEIIEIAVDLLNNNKTIFLCKY